MCFILYYNNSYNKDKNLVAIIGFSTANTTVIAFFLGTANTFEVTGMSTANTQTRTRFIFMFKFKYIINAKSTSSKN